MGLVEQVHDDIDYNTLWEEIYKVLEEHNLDDVDQVSLTSIDGENDWTSTVGKKQSLQYPERYYATINKALAGTEVEKVINRYPQYYRWRLLRLSPKNTYSVHKDGEQNQNNLRLHIPLQTNEGCFLCFYVTVPLNQTYSMVKHEHLETGKSYVVDTTNFHTAVNYGDTQRYHIVGVRYERSDS